jgi:hypothetical protein
MPNRSTHQGVGALAGGGLALAFSNGQSISHQIIEAIGGVVAGYYSGHFPDILEPANTPNHRSLAHGAAPGVALITVWAREIDSCQSFLRARADHQAALAKQAQTITSELWHLLLEFLCRVLAGAVAGALGGYGSHLVLDGFTPQSLPPIA